MMPTLSFFIRFSRHEKAQDALDQTTAVSWNTPQSCMIFVIGLPPSFCAFCAFLWLVVISSSRAFCAFLWPIHMPVSLPRFIDSSHKEAQKAQKLKGPAALVEDVFLYVEFR